jgi:hypothetical protein
MKDTWHGALRISGATSDTLRELEQNIRRISLPPYEKWRRKRVENVPFPNCIKQYQIMMTETVPPVASEYIGVVVHDTLRTSGKWSRLDLEARAASFYQSFVRQHHAQVALSMKYQNALWDVELDLYHNIDLIVPNNGRVVGLALGLDTKRAMWWRLKKEQRHPRLAVFPTKELLANQDEHRVGEFWLFHPDRLTEQIETLLSEWDSWPWPRIARWIRNVESVTAGVPNPSLEFQHCDEDPASGRYLVREDHAGHAVANLTGARDDAVVGRVVCLDCDIIVERLMLCNEPTLKGRPCRVPVRVDLGYASCRVHSGTGTGPTSADGRAERRANPG